MDGLGKATLTQLMVVGDTPQLQTTITTPQLGMIMTVMAHASPDLEGDTIRLSIYPPMTDLKRLVTGPSLPPMYWDCLN